MINYPKTSFLKRKSAPDLAYSHYQGGDILPCVMFLGGFRSDMQGTKALYLEEQCQARGQSFIRFDYRGHGQSEGTFEEACISDWAQDAMDILNYCMAGPVILVGSSMGGWISLLLALKRPQSVRSIIGLAAAPDFTSWIEAEMSEDQQNMMKTQGYFELPNAYDDTPYVITRKLIEDGRRNIMLDKELDICVPVRLIQGRKDDDVPWQTAERIKKVLSTPDVKITYLAEADHRLSAPDQLAVIGHVLAELSNQ